MLLECLKKGGLKIQNKYESHMKLKYKLILIFSIILLILLLFLTHLFFKLPDLSPIITIDTVKTNSNKEIYIKKKVVGISGSGDLIVVSQSPEKDFKGDDKTEYVYKGSIDLFYSFYNDTLNIYTSSVTSIPEIFTDKITINQHKIHGSDIFELRKNDQRRIKPLD